MKKLECIIRPHKLEEVREALDKVDVHGMTVTEVRGFGRQKGHHELYRGREYTINFLPKIKVEIVVKQEITEKVIDVIRNSVNTGQVGDGKIFVYSLSDAVRIRTGERAEEAL